MGRKVKTQYNNTNKKSRTSKRPMETYIKYFSSFYDAAMEIVRIPGCMTNCAKILLGEELHLDEKTAVVDMQDMFTKIYQENIPDFINKSNTFWAINLSIERAFLKTGNSFGIGWIINRDDKDSVTVTFKAYRPSYLEEEINYLVDNGWEKQIIEND